MGDPFSNQARKVPTVKMMQGSNTLVKLNLISGPGEAHMSRFSTMSILPQSQIEEILEQELHRQMKGGRAVERGMELDSYTSGPESVAAVVIKRERQGVELDREIVTCRYLIGCDGVHSKVRHVPGWGFEGVTLGCVWGLADVMLDQGNDLLGDVSLFYHPKGDLFVARYVRILSLLRVTYRQQYQRCS